MAGIPMQYVGSVTQATITPITNSNYTIEQSEVGNFTPYIFSFGKICVANFFVKAISPNLANWVDVGTLGIPTVASGNRPVINATNYTNSGGTVFTGITVTVFGDKLRVSGGTAGITYRVQLVYEAT